MQEAAMTNARQAAYWPTSGWRRSTPQEQGVDPAMLARAADFARENLPTLYSLLVIRNGHIVLEEHYRGHKPGDLYSVRSVTKSFTSYIRFATRTNPRSVPDYRFRASIGQAGVVRLL
jgi:hypothetical protein